MNFLRWLWTTSVILDGEGSSTRRYMCTTETGDISDTEQMMAAWESYWRRCVGYSVFSLAIALFLLQVGIVSFIAYVIIAFFLSFFFFVVVVVVVIFLWDYILPHWLTRFEPIGSASGISMCCPPCHSPELPNLLIWNALGIEINAVFVAASAADYRQYSHWLQKSPMPRFPIVLFTSASKVRSSSWPSR